MEQIVSMLRKAVDEYNMIPENETVLVALSGGKDSMLLLSALKKLSSFHPKHFGVKAVFVDMGFGNVDITLLQDYCKALDVELIIKETNLANIIFDIRKESNPCALCARMRRAILHDTAKEIGSRTIALGHHKDDVIDTFMMNLIFENRIGCFQPVTYLSRKDVFVIRPMIYISEAEIKNTVNRLGISILKSPCPMDKKTKREEIKRLITSLESEYPNIRKGLFGAVHRSDLQGWKRQEKQS